MKTTPSRRSFLKLAAACTAPAFGSLAFAAPQTKQKFDKVADVIVIGSGFAGLAAALEAKEKGASVMLLEKMPAYGGNSAINGGAFAVAGSPLQEKEGIKDSPELMLQDMIKSGRGLSHVDLLKNIVYGTRPAFDFTVKYGVKYKPFVQHFGGHSVPRIMQTIESTGGGITRPLVEAAKKLGVDMHAALSQTSFSMTKAVLSVSRFLNATITAKKIQVFLRFTAPEKALSQQPAVSLRMSPSVCSRIRHSDRTLNPPTIPAPPAKFFRICWPSVLYRSSSTRFSSDLGLLLTNAVSA